MEGEGIFYSADGSRYNGDFKDNKREGKGILYSRDGGRYEGDWKADKKEGEGIFYSTDGSRYQGQWSYNKRVGEGSLYFADGSQYEGDWKDHKREGKGIYYYPDGDRYEGEFKDGVIEGKGINYYSDGDTYEGFFSKGVRDGEGILTTTKPIRLKTAYKDGLMTHKPQVITNDQEGIISNKTDIFLSHDWGKEAANHKLVSQVNSMLKEGDDGLTTWFDEEKMEGDVRAKMIDGIDKSEVVVVFVTKEYQKKINGPDRRDNCNFEFNYAFLQKGNQKFVVVVMDPDMKIIKWTGKLAIIGDQLYVDMSQRPITPENIVELKKKIREAIAKA